MLRDRGDIPVGSDMSFFHKGKACPGGDGFLVSAGLFLALSALPVILADGLFLKHDGNIVAHRKNQTAGRAFQSAFVVHRFQLSPAHGAGEQGKQFGIQSHEASPWRSGDV